jgi:hypothetical protein
MKPPRFAGLGPLQTSEHLLQKLRHDLKRLSKDAVDVYAAFDFFVTAEHMPEWCGIKKHKEFRKAHALLRVVSNVASGAKHFEATADDHRSVQGVDARGGAFGKAFGPTTFDVSELVIEIDWPESDEFGHRISALKLAKLTLAFWEERVNQSAE